MIDITFLLLAFFVVASKMQEQAPLALPYAKHGNAIAARDAIMINIEQESADTEALFYLSRTMEKGSGIEESSEDLEELIQDYVVNQISSNDKLRYVVIRAGHETRMKNISLAKKAASKGFPEESEITIHVAVNEGQ
jgi:biopolymer transport protein TolR